VAVSECKVIVWDINIINGFIFIYIKEIGYCLAVRKYMVVVEELNIINGFYINLLFRHWILCVWMGI
jgi:hypothetical protein